MPKVEMYSTAYCPYCVRARHLLEKKGVEYTDIRVDESPERRPEMIERTNGRTSVPQIFINDFHVGGCDDMIELEVKGELDKLLAD